MPAAAAPEEAFDLTERTFSQPVDHGKAGGPRFEQRSAIVRPKGCPPDAPVFFILGAEVPLKPQMVTQAWRTYGSPKDVIFVQVEHRGYGRSLSPGEDQSVPSYVRIDQVLQDGHRVQEILEGEFTGPWMVAGYSYGGSLALWYADAYPRDVRVVLASSGAVDFPFTADSCDRYLRKYYGEGGYRRLAEHVRNLRPAAPFDNAWLARRFVAGLAASIPQRQSFSRYKPVLSFLSRLPTSWFVRATKWVEGIVNGGQGQEQLRWTASKTVTRADALSGDLSLRVWRYQQCAETGLFHVSSEKEGIFPESEKELREECRSLFGIEPARPLANRASPRDIMDHLSVPVIYVEGGEDPSDGVLHDPGHRFLKGRYFYSPAGRHCPDRADGTLGKAVLAEMLRFARPARTEALVAAIAGEGYPSSVSGLQ